MKHVFNLCKIVEGCTDISSNDIPLVCVSPCCVYWRTSGSALHQQCAEERMTGSASCDAQGPLKALFRGEFKDVPIRDKVEMGAIPSLQRGACPIRGAPRSLLLPMLECLQVIVARSHSCQRGLLTPKCVGSFLQVRSPVCSDPGREVGFVKPRS